MEVLFFYETIYNNQQNFSLTYLKELNKLLNIFYVNF